MVGSSCHVAGRRIYNVGMKSGVRLLCVPARLSMAVLAVFLLAAGAIAQEPAAAGTSKLESVRVTGSVRFRSEQIAPATGLTPGATVSKDDLQQGADHLVRLGLFANVQYRFVTLATGVRVEYQVTDAPALPVWFDNFPWFTDDELTAELTRDVPLFDGKAPQQGSVVEDLSSALERFLLVHGVHVSISHTIETAPTTGEQVQSFHAENSGLNVASVAFSDPLAHAHGTLRIRAGPPCLHGARVSPGAVRRSRATSHR